LIVISEQDRRQNSKQVSRFSCMRSFRNLYSLAAQVCDPHPRKSMSFVSQEHRTTAQSSAIQRGQDCDNSRRASGCMLAGVEPPCTSAQASNVKGGTDASHFAYYCAVALSRIFPGVALQPGVGLLSKRRSGARPGNSVGSNSNGKILRLVHPAQAPTPNRSGWRRNVAKSSSCNFPRIISRLAR
jgi:hypothetical protein